MITSDTIFSAFSKANENYKKYLKEKSNLETSSRAKLKKTKLSSLFVNSVTDELSISYDSNKYLTSCQKENH
jgi:hypothetical protein